MQNATSVATKPEPQAEPPILLKKIGSTTYSVAVRFSKTNKETVGDKLFRLIKNEGEKQ